MLTIRRIFSIVLFLSLVLSTGYAQRSYLGLSFGASIPSEEFANKSVIEDGGYAEPGFVIEFSGAYIFDYYIGIAGSFTCLVKLYRCYNCKSKCRADVTGYVIS